LWGPIISSKSAKISRKIRTRSWRDGDRPELILKGVSAAERRQCFASSWWTATGMGTALPEADLPSHELPFALGVIAGATDISFLGLSELKVVTG
jgi:hypothetical protein